MMTFCSERSGATEIVKLLLLLQSCTMLLFCGPRNATTQKPGPATLLVLAWASRCPDTRLILFDCSGEGFLHFIDGGFGKQVRISSHHPFCPTSGTTVTLIRNQPSDEASMMLKKPETMIHYYSQPSAVVGERHTGSEKGTHEELTGKFLVRLL
jgi:hypothetical protein